MKLTILKIKVLSKFMDLYNNLVQFNFFKKKLVKVIPVEYFLESLHFTSIVQE